jgi:hypothetical protein
VAALRRNQWLEWIGITGCFAPEPAPTLKIRANKGRRRQFMSANVGNIHAVVIRRYGPPDVGVTARFDSKLHAKQLGPGTGSEILSAAWLEREVAFLLGWERDRLSPALL